MQLGNNLEKYNTTTEEIAKILGYHIQYVRFLAASGKLPAVKRGRAWRFDQAEVLAFLKQQTSKATNGADNAEGTDSGRDLLR